jgi:hypothetical protein
VLDKVTISYRGAGYELGGGRDYFAVWGVGAPRSQPLERWPRTREGWSAAWSRFTSVEVPGTIRPAGARSVTDLGARAGTLIAAALLAVGVVLGIAGLFPV